jgi:hypothetical protein
MKKVILVLFLFYAKAATAQGFNFGIGGGYLGYNFNKDGSNYDHSSLSLGVCAQYVFKDSLFGVEGNLLLYTSAPITGTYSYAFAPYFFFNVAPSHPLSLEIKLGLMSLHNLNALAPVNDIGPSGGLYLYFTPRHAPEMGIDFTVFLGQEFYTLYEATPSIANPIAAIPSKLITYNLSFKILVP